MNWLRRLLLNPVRDRVRSRAFWHDVLDLAQDVVDQKISPVEAGEKLLTKLLGL